MFLPLVNLETLLLDQNYLEDINGVFSSVSSLSYLSISHNNLKWFDMAFFPKTIQTINMSRNCIEEIGNYYNMLEGFSLQSLDLSYNKIGSLGNNIFVESMEEINLEGNNISEISSGTFLGLPSIKKVNLYNNSLKTLPQDSLKISNLHSKSIHTKTFTEILISRFIHLPYLFQPIPV